MGHNDDDDEQIRRSARVRTFAWATPVPHQNHSHLMGTRLCQDIHFIAICNDNNQLVLVAIDSPATTYGSQKNWTARVLTSVSLDSHTPDTTTEPACLEDFISQQRHLSRVAWSPWKVSGDRYHSVIAYSTNNDVRGRVATLSDQNLSLGDEITYARNSVRFTGPMKWSSLAGKNDTSNLALFAEAGVSNLEISLENGSVIRSLEHNLDGRWDQISGAVWIANNGFTNYIHFSSLLSTIETPTCVLEVTSDRLQAAHTPSWRDQIHNSAILFSVKNDLSGNNKVKVWGLAASPLHNFIASCTSNHPADMIEYGAPNERRGTISVTALQPYNQMRQAFPAFDVSAEGILFTLKKLVENTIEETSQTPEFAAEMIEKLGQAYTPPTPGTEEKQKDRTQIEGAAVLSKIVQSFKRRAYFDPNSLKDRYAILVSRACDEHTSIGLHKTLIAYRLAIALSDPPRNLATSTFSAEIIKHHQQLVVLVDKLTSMTETSDELMLRSQDMHMDHCEFCTAAIPFTDLTTATCLNGHQFPRCGLSFLAVQAPGISKYCGICSTPYLSEEFVAAQEQGTVQLGFSNGKHVTKDQGRTSGETAETNKQDGLDGHAGEECATLAQILFFACDACIYCGGKFID